MAQTLARQFGTLDALMAASRDDINEVPGVGNAIGEAVADFFGEERNRRSWSGSRSAGLNFTEPRAASSDGPLKGLSVVLTGTLPTLSRAKATELIEQAGGKVGSAVTGKTSFLVAGEEAGSKLEKAKKLRCPR